MCTVRTPQELHIRRNNDEIKQTSNVKATSQRHLNVPSVVKCRINRPSNNNDIDTDSYEQLLSMLLSNIEPEARNVNNIGNDHCVQCTYRDLRGSLSMICSDVLTETFQLCFLSGTKNWSTLRSARAVSTVVTVLKTTDSGIVRDNLDCHCYFMSTYRLELAVMLTVLWKTGQICCVYKAFRNGVKQVLLSAAIWIHGICFEFHTMRRTVYVFGMYFCDRPCLFDPELRLLLLLISASLFCRNRFVQEYNV